MIRNRKNEPIVISALRVRSNFGRLLRQVEEGSQSLVIEKNGTAKAVLLSVKNYVRLAAPEPEVLREIGAQSKVKGTDKLTSAQIDRIIKRARSQKHKS